MKKNTVYEEEHNGIVINVFSDNDAQSPEDWGNDDVCFWDSRNLSIKNKNVSRDIFGAYIKEEGFEEYKEEAKELKNNFHVFGVDAYIHSGIALSLHGEGMNCRWDTSRYIGCIIVAKKEARTAKKAEGIARGILECWNDYLSGNVYGYNLEDKDTGETFGGCWGFYGDYEKNGMLDDARSEVDAYIKNEKRDAIKSKIEALRSEAEALESKL